MANKKKLPNALVRTILLPFFNWFRAQIKQIVITRNERKHARPNSRKNIREMSVAGWLVVCERSGSSLALCSNIVYIYYCLFISEICFD